MTARSPNPAPGEGVVWDDGMGDPSISAWVVRCCVPGCGRDQAIVAEDDDPGGVTTDEAVAIGWGSVQEDGSEPKWICPLHSRPRSS